MATGDRIRQSAQRARALADQKRLKISDLRGRINDMRHELDQLGSAVNDWDREMASMQNDLGEIERIATEFDAIEQKMRVRK